jgi:hypothetical protein
VLDDHKLTSEAAVQHDGEHEAEPSAVQRELCEDARTLDERTPK